MRGIMIRFELNGRTADPNDLTDVLMKAAMESVAEEMHQKVSSICHPVTGEFPTVVVSGTNFENMQLRIEGSPELLELVNERLGLVSDAGHADGAVVPPKVFLSYAWEDQDMAEKIATTLQSRGIDTWWDKWCMLSGDSLRQKIDEGLGDCTHFVVLLTPISLTKPWVNQEMDAALMLKLQSKCKFIPLRLDLQPAQLPPLLGGMVSPAVDRSKFDISQLVADIHGINKKPPLGPAPKILENSLASGYSAAANAVAKEFVLATEFARKYDPWIDVDTLMEKTGLSHEDLVDAIQELTGLVDNLHEYRVNYFPEAELFVKFDKFWMGWDPETDALKLAADMVNDKDFPTSPEFIGARYGWDSRRLNPAMSYLMNRKLADGYQVLESTTWGLHEIEGNDATRRFLKSRN